MLLDLAHKGRVSLAMESGVLNLVPSQTRTNFNLTMADATIDEALQMISGATGLEFIKTDEGIRVEASDVLKGSAPPGDAQRKGPRFMVRMLLPMADGTKVEVYMRPEDLPDGMVEQINKEKDKLIRDMGFEPKPLTQPATAGQATKPAN